MNGPDQPPYLPSPAEVEAAMLPNGAFPRLTLASWGVAWPPKKGWRTELRRAWMAKNSHPIDEKTVWQSLWQGGVAQELFIGSLAFLGGPDLHLTPIMLRPGDLVELRVKRAPRKP